MEWSPEGTTPAPGAGGLSGRAWRWCGRLGAPLRPVFAQYFPYVVEIFIIKSPGSPEVRVSFSRRVLFRAVFARVLFSQV